LASRKRIRRSCLNFLALLTKIRICTINKVVDLGSLFVNKIVEVLGGEIHIESVYMIGTKVMFWIKCIPDKHLRPLPRYKSSLFEESKVAFKDVSEFENLECPLISDYQMNPREKFMST
jgi:hypothetical protein